MNVVSFNGHVIDLSEVVGADCRTDSIVLTFKNGDSIDLRWRDGDERASICKILNEQAGIEAR
ncbi:MAG TPA: hypothetical protein VF773_17835 [Verrucomicrobiae bacterium]